MSARLDVLGVLARIVRRALVAAPAPLAVYALALRRASRSRRLSDAERTVLAVWEEYRP